MPFALLIIGITLLVSGVRGTQTQLYTLVKGDFTGTPNYGYWVLAILIIGSIGYVPQLRSLSRAFLALVIVVLLLSKGGFFLQFQKQIYGTSQN